MTATPAQIRAIKSVDPEVGSINATDAVFRRVVEAGWVTVDPCRGHGMARHAHAAVTDAGRAVVAAAERAR